MYTSFVSFGSVALVGSPPHVQQCLCAARWIVVERGDDATQLCPRSLCDGAGEHADFFLQCLCMFCCFVSRRHACAAATLKLPVDDVAQCCDHVTPKYILLLALRIA
jgi:hypothetical protein